MISTVLVVHPGGTQGQICPAHALFATPRVHSVEKPVLRTLFLLVTVHCC